MRTSWVLALVLIVVLSAGGFVAAQQTYELSMADASEEIDTPTRDVTVEGETVEFSATGKVSNPGNDIVVNVDAPDTASVQLRDAEDPDAIVDSTRLGSDEEVTFDDPGSGYGDPGTYAILIRHDGNFQTALPVVVEGYDVSVTDYPSDADVGDEITVTVSVSEDELSGDPDRVEVSAHRNDEVVNETASKVDGDYEANLSFDDVDTGDYSLYAIALDESSSSDFPIGQGLSDGNTITIESSDDGNGDGGGDGGGEQPVLPPLENTTEENVTEEELAEPGTVDVIEDTEAVEDLAEAPEGSEPTRAERAGLPENTTDGTPSVAFTNESSVDRIEFTNDSQGSNVTVVDYEPSSVSESSPGTSVAVTQIDVPEDLADKGGTVRMRVPQERLAELNASADELRVHHLSGDSPEAVPTTPLNETDDHVFLQAETDHFSLFSVDAVSEPNATLSVTPAAPAPGDEVTLNASESTDEYGEIEAYEWMVSEETLTNATQAVIFAESGEYNVTLTVTNDAGETDTASTAILVEEQDSTDSNNTTSDDGSETDEDPDDGSAGNDTATDGDAETDEDGDELLEPNESADTDDTTESEATDEGTDADGPGFGVLTGLLAVFVSVALISRRSD